MSITKILILVQLIVAVLLVLTILLQSRGAGLSGTFGGDSAIHTVRRGPEKFLYGVTIVLALIFVGIAIANLVLT